MYTIDVTKNQLSKVINDQQRELNNSNTHRLRENRSDLIIEKNGGGGGGRRGRNSTEHKAYIHKNLADIQKEQIQLRKLGAADDLIKNRIEDEQNLLNHNERFPYGKQNVDISQDVLQRYKGNYLQQSHILQKFRLEAELMKKTSRVKGNHSKPFQWCYRDDGNNNKKKEEELKKMRETMQKQWQEDRLVREQERKNMKDIAKTLSGLSLQLHNNSYTLEKGIRDLQHQLKKSQKKVVPQAPKHSYRDILDLETSSKKIPIIVYKNQPHDARLYFSDIYREVPKIRKEDSMDMDRKEYGNIVKVLSQNNRRLRYLDRVLADDGDSSSIL